MGAGRQQVARELGTAVQVYQRSTDAFDDVVADRLGLNHTDLRCLDWLSGGPMAIGQLSHATGLSSAATTKLVDRLEQKGFVRRVRDGTDRRRILVDMTPAAAARAAELYGPLVAEGDQLLRDYDVTGIAMLRDYFAAAADLVDRHRIRIAALQTRSIASAGVPRRTAETTPVPERRPVKRRRSTGGDS
jgi:DNA-binding MarR family transcriptional regulator